MDKRLYLFEKEKVGKSILTMSLPAIIGFLVMAIYNLVDTMFVAWLGTQATSATQVVMPVMMLVSAFGLAYGVGSGSYLSRVLGMNRMDKASEIATTSFALSVMTGIVFTILSLVFIQPLLAFFGANADIMAMSVGYGRYILLGSLFTMGNMTMNNLLRAEGSAKLSMIGMTAGAVLNIVLDPLFIFTFKMGIEGAAIATTLSQGISFFILFSRYLFKKSMIEMGISHFKVHADLLKEIGKIGIPTFCRQLLFSISMGFLNRGAMTYGSASLLAAVGISYKVMLIPMYCIFGLGQGFQPVVGYNFGAKNRTRVLDSIRHTFIYTLGIAFISALLVFLFDSAILSIFKAAPAVEVYAIQGLHYSAIALFFMAISNTIGVYYQAIGRGRESLVLSVARQGIFYLPMIFLLPQAIGAAGILSAQLGADILTLVLSVLLFGKYILNQSLDHDLRVQHS